MHNINMEHVTPVGTIFGGLFALITLPTTASIISAIIIAGIGATTGFFVTLIWKWIMSKIKIKMKKTIKQEIKDSK